MKSQFDACSFGKFQVTSDYGGAINEKSLSAPGVIEIKLSSQLSELTQAQLRVEAANLVQEELAVDIGTIFDHVVFVVESCYEVEDSVCGMAAYAFVNHWLSIFFDDNWMYPAVQVGVRLHSPCKCMSLTVSRILQLHEIGHNLNLAHSGGLDGKTYTDHTCLMGNPLWEDDIASMCFNPVKNFQIAKKSNAWFQARHIQTFNSGTAPGTHWKGKLVGVADYTANSGEHPIVIKLESGTGNDYFVGFNHATGVNADAVQHRNLVTVYQVVGGDGFGYSTSSLKAVVGAGNTAKLYNWRKTGHTLKIKVNSINTGAYPLGYADVSIEFGNPPPPTMPPTRAPSPRPTNRPTKRPSNMPTKRPSNMPTSRPTTASLLRPTNLPTLLPTSEPTPSPPPTYSPTSSLPPSSKPSSSPTQIPTNQPTEVCGNKVCEMILDETPDQCPLDCIEEHDSVYITGEANKEALAIMFDVTAKRDVAITSLDVIAKKDGEDEVLVYSKLGSYSGFERDESQWENILTETVTLTADQTNNLSWREQPLKIKAGETRAFYIVTSKRKIMYVQDDEEGRLYAQNNVLEIKSGIVSKGEFQNGNGEGRFSGTLGAGKLRENNMPQRHWPLRVSQVDKIKGWLCRAQEAMFLDIQGGVINRSCHDGIVSSNKGFVLIDGQCAQQLGRSVQLIRAYPVVTGSVTAC
ncbi:hypothetical protein THAOC_37278 [Thalassiosira oceanica]|uniref:Peptidase M11 gametolysin domain-containing protein n=1 Tax=Thalassiosira oceanica TaxID=159749 RepID=K0QZ15_THAOC|nr:hypothetical protein THAOC_37278 [Thalassiosira oceanica]|eukprot:EJK44205.1 hypothetical protein THAOC_37278 [Thalassiosira oceanica]